MHLVTLVGTGEGVWIAPQAYLDMSQTWSSKLIEMDDYAVITYGAVVLVHEMVYQSDIISHYGRVRMEKFSTIRVNAFVGPGVHIGLGSIVAVGAVLTGPCVIPPMEIWGGVPARRIGSVYDMLAKRRALVVEGAQRGYEAIKAIPLGQRLTIQYRPNAIRNTAILNGELRKIGMPEVPMPPEVRP